MDAKVPEQRDLGQACRETLADQAVIGKLGLRSRRACPIPPPEYESGAHQDASRLLGCWQLKSAAAVPQSPAGDSASSHSLPHPSMARMPAWTIGDLYCRGSLPPCFSVACAVRRTRLRRHAAWLRRRMVNRQRHSSESGNGDHRVEAAAQGGVALTYVAISDIPSRSKCTTTGNRTPRAAVTPAATTSPAAADVRAVRAPSAMRQLLPLPRHLLRRAVNVDIQPSRVMAPGRQHDHPSLLSLEAFEIGKIGGRLQAGDVPVLLGHGVLPQRKTRQLPLRRNRSPVPCPHEHF